MIRELLKSLRQEGTTNAEASPAAAERRLATQQEEKRARVEAVERTLRLYDRREVTVRELSNAAQVNERHVRRILIHLTADGKVAFDGHRVRLIS
ncbi:hypothetical protein [Aromatoleum evansii]|uniref:hypothetical protein n=1 Tax=Aromatoleum evansii TaxID=59406 RepID=UPI00145CC5BB|nr:hypothetical protein [Aromatoleum evansii]NMG30618.1 hypothetical protein [Aromatoleum evansii]